jgi:cytochrome oxidase Cu insertion factor (SCO1/SenC/PrrC family)
VPGMSTGLEANDPTVVSAFHSALVTQGLIVIGLIVLVGSVWILLGVRELLHAGAGRANAFAGSPTYAFPEPAARRLLRIGFGALWILDGVLQTQPKMPLGMGPDVIQPLAAASPSWVQHVDNALVSVWSYHPTAAAAAVVWIQLGIGVWLLAAPRGNWSRLAGLASVLWALNVWVFGEAFGGIFAPGLTWLFGAPGAAVFYCVAGCLIALPESAWTTPRTGRIVLRGTGLFFLGMAVLQAWPGRGFWSGEIRPGVTSGTLTAMVREMSQTPQPHVLASLVSSFEGFVAANGWGVNLFVVIALAAIGTAFLTVRASIVRIGVIAGCVLCLADWVLIEDFGFFGGLGTDPNSMIPMALVFVAGYVALTRVPVHASELVAGEAVQPTGVRTWRQRLRADPTYAFRSLAALAALAITIVGAVPLAVAATEPHADPIIAEALDGAPDAVDTPATPFTLVDQRDQPVSLAALRGRTVALTFLDDVCTSDCPIIAQEFRLADSMLGPEASRVEMVAVNLNPLYLASDYLAAFDRQEHLEGVHNWLYLTGSLAQLTHVWRAYGAVAEYSPGGAMVAHSESADVIDANGQIRYLLNTDPGPGTEASRSSFASTLADALKRAIRAS